MKESNDQKTTETAEQLQCILATVQRSLPDMAPLSQRFLKAGNRGAPLLQKEAIRAQVFCSAVSQLGTIAPSDALWMADLLDHLLERATRQNEARHVSVHRTYDSKAV